MSSESYDIVVIGAGPGGYVAAIRAAQLGMKVACVEKRTSLGGTCLNVGCIPSKALLSASEHFAETARLKDVGVVVGDLKLDLPAMMKHKDSVVDSNTNGIAFLFKKNKITRLEGHGKIIEAGRVEVDPGDGREKIIVETESVIIATGSDVMSLPGIEIDEKRIVSSTGALDLPEVPNKLVVIGGGVIGLELGCVWSRLGAEVTIVEYMDGILVGMDGEIRKQAQRILKKQGLDFKLKAKVTGAKVSKSGVKMTVESASGGNVEELSSDYLLVCVGRKPYTEGLGLEDIGVLMDERGRINVDQDFQTNVAGVYAVGDVIRGPMLAHKAEDEGVILAEMLAGEHPHINYDAIPNVVYTEPEIAAVGKTEEQLKESGVKYKTGKFPFSANGRARAMNLADGLVKIMSDDATDQILGAHIIGRGAGDLLQELVLAMESDLTAEDVARTCHSHPTLSEAVKEAALAATAKRPIHM